MKAANFFVNLKNTNANVMFCDKPTAFVKRKTVSLGDARASVVANLKANKAVFGGASNDKVFANYKRVGDTFQFSIKYGIRSLSNVLGGHTYVNGLTAEQMEHAFDAAVALVEAGECDVALNEAIAANAAMRKKRVKTVA